MKTKGIIISQEDYDRLTDIEKNFDAKVAENRGKFKKGLEDAIKGDLVKILWVDDENYANLKGCDLKEENITTFIRREDADFVDKLSSRESYDKEKIIKINTKKKNAKRIADHKAAFGLYQDAISNQRKTIRNLWWSFGIMLAAWVVMVIAYITK